MGLIEINRHPTRRQLAVFGLAWLVFFFILGLAAANHQSDWIAGVVWTIAGLIPVVGWLLPGFMRLVFRWHVLRNTPRRRGVVSCSSRRSVLPSINSGGFAHEITW